MPETLEKLRADRDLQCFFFHPSAIAAISESSASGFKVTGCWRQQFDWAVIEWNRDNVYEHPAFRYLPDGDLSGLTLTYEETRRNCIGMDSDLFATVDWPSLRIWVGDNDLPEFVPLLDHATPIEGPSTSAYADFTLSGTVHADESLGLAFLGENHWYSTGGWETVGDVLDAIVAHINSFSAFLTATRTGTTVRVFYPPGANGNRFGMYSYSTGSLTWDAPEKVFANGTSPTKWRISLNFASLVGAANAEKIRKMRWTYAADQQRGAFERREFEVAISNWTVTGTGRGYKVAGPQSRRIEDGDPEIVFSGGWANAHGSAVRGNFSGGTIRKTTTYGDLLTCVYNATAPHHVYLGLRYTKSGARAAITVDGSPRDPVDLQVDEEDVLIRWPLGELSAGPHTITVKHDSPAGGELFFDFVELAAPASNLPEPAEEPGMTLATDWDTDHSLAIAPERTAWMLDSLGFRARQNHYAGALWFYELTRRDHVYASATVTLSGTPNSGETVTITVSRGGADTILVKTIHQGDTLETIVRAFALELNKGYTGIRGEASGAVLTVFSRSMGEDGRAYSIEASSSHADLTPAVSEFPFQNGEDGTWITDLAATPRINRAARDWTRSFLAALHARGIESTVAFSTELQHGDRSVEAGIAQRGPGGDEFYLPTPALQTNFSPASLAFWKQVYADMAAVMSEAGMTPYLQFGEEQWWYFPHNGYPADHPLRHNFSGMPFYDEYTTATFESTFGRPLPEFLTNDVDPALYPDEAGFLSGLIGDFTGSIMEYVRASFPAAKFEVLYPADVNQTSFNKAFNYPQSSWTPSALQCLKTENFGFTFGRDLSKAEDTLLSGAPATFTASKRAHLVGIGDGTAPWLKESRIAQGKKFESVVLFALDQFCLMGYGVPLKASSRRGVRVGGG
jgi:hypothetical protein